MFTIDYKKSGNIANKCVCFLIIKNKTDKMYKKIFVWLRVGEFMIQSNVSWTTILLIFNKILYDTIELLFTQINVNLGIRWPNKCGQLV